MKLKLGTKNFSKIFNNLLKNQVVLYLVALLALYCVVQYTMKNNLAAIGLLLAIGYCATRFTKNMIIVLLSSIIITKVLINCGLFKTLGIREGLTNEGEDEGKDEGKDESDNESKEGDKKRKKSEDLIKNVIKKEKKEIKELEKAEKAEKESEEVSGNSGTTFKKDYSATSAFSNLNDSPDLTGSGAKIDYAGTVERAFDNLEKILGSDGIKKMSDDTARLAEKQENLVNAMKNMQPLMDNAQKMLKTIEGTPFAGMIGAGGLLGNKKKE